MIKKIYNFVLKKFLWKLARPVSGLLFLSHKISYDNPFGKKPLANNIDK